MLRIEGASVRFGGVSAVAQMSLDCSAGEIVGLIGPNGAGKTTLLNAVTGIVRTSGGLVEIDGREVTRLPVWRRARMGLARTFQAPRLFSPLPVDVQLRALVGSHRARAVEILEPLGQAHLLEADPSGLSYGSQRILEIARALCLAPKLLLLDEPIAGMSGTEATAVTELVRGLAADGLAVVVVEHNLHMISSLCARVFVMAAGRSVTVGRPEDVIAHPDVVSSYLGAPVA